VANDGPRMKRIRPAPMGRAYRYVRRIAHIEILLAERGKNGSQAETGPSEVDEAKARPRGKTRAKKPAGKKTVGKR
jgi:large subunit ribosomal protein L22